MMTTQYYPVLQVRDVANTAAFYVRHFDFVPMFEADWYVHLQSRHDPRVNLAILDKSLRDEAFGQRHFITRDPNGVLIDVIRPIPPDADFAAQYQPDALPT
jgi:hypothetical protein